MCQKNEGTNYWEILQKNFPKSEELLKQLTRMWFEDMRKKTKNVNVQIDDTQIMDKEDYSESQLTNLRRLIGPKGHELGPKLVRLT